jgi:hypothetical protein
LKPLPNPPLKGEGVRQTNLIHNYALSSGKTGSKDEAVISKSIKNGKEHSKVLFS